MSINFSADQYEGAFVSHRLQNWEVPMKHKNATWFNDHYHSGRPTTQEGFTQIIANDRGHINECIPRSEKNPWGDFVGTWDLPKKIPGNCASVETARCPNAKDLLQRHKKAANVVMGGQQKNTTRKYKGQEPPVQVPECASASKMLEQETCLSPVYCATAEERRSGAEAPAPTSTSPAAAVKTPSPGPAVAEQC